LTVTGAERLRAELQDLKTVQRPAIIAGDCRGARARRLSENAEYHAAKERQSFIEGRIAEVESKLSNAQIIDPDARRGWSLRVRRNRRTGGCGESGDIVTYQIVGDDEADIKDGKISISSPIARALIGKYAGRRCVEVQAPGGVRHYDVLDVEYK
jgi:transcription elongation factor GreA